jgi:hypothetical protein
MNDVDNIPRNLRVLLWRRQIPRERWVSELSRWAECDRQRVFEILRGDSKLTDAETQAISAVTDIDSTQLFYDDLLEGVDVFTENIKFLLGSLEHGGRKRLAEHLNVTEGTVYKWGGGSQPPKRNHTLGIISFIGLRPEIDLGKEPLFLSLEPIGARAKKEWLIKRIQDVEDHELDMYYPALRKILD